MCVKAYIVKVYYNQQQQSLAAQDCLLCEKDKHFMIKTQQYKKF